MVAILSLLSEPASLPTANAVFLPSNSSIHLIGPEGNGLVKSSKPKRCRILLSRSGNCPWVNESPPPKWAGMLQSSIYSRSVGKTSGRSRTTNFSAVWGSTQLFKHFQIVVKYDGALHTCRSQVSSRCLALDILTHEDFFDSFWIAGR
jgi:hypothetical protein